MQFALSIAIAVACLALPALARNPQAPSPAETRQPVLVELFTSEGCSDCPPADALLARMDETQFIPGAHVIVLSEHVTYWNHDGWFDPFSMDAMDERQAQYVSRFGLQSSYTPQAVVDGAAQAVGNATGAVTAEVARAAETPKAKLAIENARWENGAAQFSVRIDPRPHATFTAVLAENATRSEVSRGENKGRTLTHVAVVRVMRDFGSNATDGRPLRLSAGSLAKGKDATGPVRLVVFLTDRMTGHILAIAEQMLQR